MSKHPDPAHNRGAFDEAVALVTFAAEALLAALVVKGSAACPRD